MGVRGVEGGAQRRQLLEMSTGSPRRGGGVDRRPCLSCDASQGDVGGVRLGQSGKVASAWVALALRRVSPHAAQACAPRVLRRYARCKALGVRGPTDARCMRHRRRAPESVLEQGGGATVALAVPGGDGSTDSAQAAAESHQRSSVHRSFASVFGCASCRLGERDDEPNRVASINRRSVHRRACKPWVQSTVWETEP